MEKRVHKGQWEHHMLCHGDNWESWGHLSSLQLLAIREFLLGQLQLRGGGGDREVQN